MNNHCITSIMAIAALSFGTGAMAENMSQSEYKAAGKKIVAEYKSNRKECILYAHSHKNTCMAEAKRTEKADRADLEASYRPSTKMDNSPGVTRQRQSAPLSNTRVMTLSATSRTTV